ncbi:MAG TPA: NAD(P)H:quinone oxidoreductase [Chlamydiales bacterium]|nr:NAD(P)H:quinone oxidoreductase [Chlamydiales bacterium]
MKPKVLILYYSMYGNTYQLANHIAKAVKENGGEPLLRKAPELIEEDQLIANPGYQKSLKMQKNVPTIKIHEFSEVDALILGSPTRFGNMCAQLRNVLDQTGSLWLKGSLIDKPAGVFCCTGSLHGGQETTLISMMQTLLHHGCLIVGVPYSQKELLEAKHGGTPYGPTTVVGEKADHPPTKNDLKIAWGFGERITKIAMKMRKV